MSGSASGPCDDEVAVRGSKVMVEAKWPVWKVLRCSNLSPLEEPGSVGTAC